MNDNLLPNERLKIKINLFKTLDLYAYNCLIIKD